MANFKSARKMSVVSDLDELNIVIGKVRVEYPLVTFDVSSTTTNGVHDVVFESNSQVILDQVEAIMRSLLPSKCVLHKSAPGSLESLALLDEYARKHSYVDTSLDVIKECYQTYQSEEVCVSFNGGKDCTALLHLVHSFHVRKFGKDVKLKVLFIRMPESFTPLDEFVSKAVDFYNLELLVYDGPDYKIALEKLKKSTNIKAIFMGTRRSDVPSNVEMQVFQPTDVGWPELVRVNAMLEWTYAQVWSFIRDLEVPYCSLYDQGYTSLGSPANTQRNPSLMFQSKSGEIWYLPAYMLQDHDKERTSRTK